jgi:DNA-binding CsgD family transcriptional regulator
MLAQAEQAGSPAMVGEAPLSGSRSRRRPDLLRCGSARGGGGAPAPDRSDSLGGDCRVAGRIQAVFAPPERVSGLLTNDGGVVMPRGVPLSEAVRDGIWELRAEGLSDREIGRRLGLGTGIVSNHLRWVGGIRPRARRRPERCLSLEEREEISRGIARGASARAIARALGRSHTTVAREINRCGGRRRYRAQAAVSSPVEKCPTFAG